MRLETLCVIEHYLFLCKTVIMYCPNVKYHQTQNKIKINASIYKLNMVYVIDDSPKDITLYNLPIKKHTIAFVYIMCFEILCVIKHYLF